MLNGLWRCLLGRHDWHQHPEFVVFEVRECRRCLQVQSRSFGSGDYVRRPHLEREIDRTGGGGR